MRGDNRKERYSRRERKHKYTGERERERERERKREREKERERESQNWAMEAIIGRLRRRITWKKVEVMGGRGEGGSG